MIEDSAERIPIISVQGMCGFEYDHASVYILGTHITMYKNTYIQIQDGNQTNILCC